MEQAADIIEQPQRERLLVDHSGTLAGAFEFTDKTVAEVEVTLGNVVTLPETATPADVQRFVIEYGHSRYVVSSGTSLFATNRGSQLVPTATRAALHQLRAGGQFVGPASG